MNCFKAEKNGPNCEVFHRFGLTLFLMPAVAAVEAEGAAAAAAVADVVGVVGVGLAALAASNLCCIVRTCDAGVFPDTPLDGLVVVVVVEVVIVEVVIVVVVVVGLVSLVALVVGVFKLDATPPTPARVALPVFLAVASPLLL